MAHGKVLTPVSRSTLRYGQHPAASEQAIKKRAYLRASALTGRYPRLFILIKSEYSTAATDALKRFESFAATAVLQDLEGTDSSQVILKKGLLDCRFSDLALIHPKVWFGKSFLLET